MPKTSLKSQIANLAPDVSPDAEWKQETAQVADGYEARLILVASAKDRPAEAQRKLRAVVRRLKIVK
jgi:hypothetical protein